MWVASYGVMPQTYSVAVGPCAAGSRTPLELSTNRIGPPRPRPGEPPPPGQRRRPLRGAVDLGVGEQCGQPSPQPAPGGQVRTQPRDRLAGVVRQSVPRPPPQDRPELVVHVEGEPVVHPVDRAVEITHDVTAL